MNKKIEAAWKEGFLHDDALVAPKVNDLYGRKSEQMADRLVRGFRLNHRIVVAVAVIGFLVSIPVGAPVAGIVFAVSLGIFAAHARSYLVKLERLDRTLDVYHYLKTFNDSIIVFMTKNVRAFRFAVPVIMMSGNEIILPDIAPLAARVPMLVMAILVFIFAGPVSRFDVNLVYRGPITRLREMQSDMEELRGSGG